MQMRLLRIEECVLKLRLLLLLLLLYSSIVRILRSNLLRIYNKPYICKERSDVNCEAKTQLIESLIATQQHADSLLFGCKESNCCRRVQRDGGQFRHHCAEAAGEDTDGRRYAQDVRIRVAKLSLPGVGRRRVPVHGRFDGAASNCVRVPRRRRRSLSRHLCDFDEGRVGVQSRAQRTNGTNSLKFFRSAVSQTDKPVQEFYSYDPEADKISQVRQQIDDVKGVMVSNIEKVLARGDKIEELVDATDGRYPCVTVLEKPAMMMCACRCVRRLGLQNTSFVYRKQARRLKRKMWWQNYKCIIAIVFFLLVRALVGV
jgi:hypothetical protein